MSRKLTINMARSKKLSPMSRGAMSHKGTFDTSGNVVNPWGRVDVVVMGVGVMSAILSGGVFPDWMRAMTVASTSGAGVASSVTELATTTISPTIWGGLVESWYS